MTKISLVVAAMMACMSMSACTPNSDKAKTQGQQQKAAAKSYTVHLTKAEFIEKVMDFENNPTEWKYKGDKPAIVDFYATWCGPCKAISPILEQLAKEYDGKIVIYKVDVDKEGELAAAFNVQSIPMLLFIPKEGKPAVGLGMMTAEELKKQIDDVLLK